MKKFIFFLALIFMVSVSYVSAQNNSLLKNVSPAEREMAQMSLKESLSAIDQSATITEPTRGGSRAVLLNETFSSPSLPAGWLNLDVDGDTYKWQFTSTNSGCANIYPAGHGDTYCINSASYYNCILDLFPDNYLITPQLTANGPVEISWWVMTFDAAFPAETYQVRISTTGTAPANFTQQIFQETLTSAAATWVKRTVTFDATGPFYIAFRHCNSNDQYIMLIDDIFVETISCGPPSNFAVNYSGNNAVLTWTGSPTANSCNIYRDGVLVGNATGTTYTDNTMNPSLPHTWCVTSVCDGGEESSSVCVSKPSANECAPITDLTVDYVANCGAQLNWTSPKATLWDNTNINMGTGGLISSYWANNNNWIVCADDFDVEGPWIIERIQSRGFQSASSVLPTKMSVVIYANNANKPGAELYRNDAIPTSFDDGYCAMTLPTPFTLPGAGKYWISIAGAYDATVNANAQIANFRWNIYYGSTKIGLDFHLHDKMGLIATTNPNEWLEAQPLLGSANYSMYFKIEGDKNTGNPPPVYNVYRDGVKIASNVPTASYLDPNPVPTEGHTWGVEAVCGGFPTAMVTKYKSLCSFGDCTTDETIHGTATTTAYTLPISTFYNRSYSQQIFTEAELGLQPGDIIYEVSFEYIFATPQGPGGKTNQTFYLGSTCGKDGFTATEWIPLSNLSQVFQGTVQYNNSQKWSTIEFDDPFIYQGGHLVLAVFNNSGGYNTSSNATFRYSTPAGTRKTQFYQTDGALDPATNTATSTAITNRANTRFGVCKFAPRTTDMAAVGITGELTPMTTKPYDYTVTVKNYGVAPANTYTVSVATTDGLELAKEIITTPLAPNATAAHILSVTIPHALAGSLGIVGKVEFAGDQYLKNNETPCGLALGVIPHPGYELDCIDKQITTVPGTGTVYTIPANNLWNRSYTQQIYDAADIGLPAGTPLGYLSFHTSYSATYTKANQSIYLGNISKSTFTGSYDLIPATDLTLVYTGPMNVVGNSWFKMEFNEQPFTYAGNNIVVVVVNNAGTWPSSSNTFTTHPATNKATHIYTDNVVILSPTNVPTGFSGGVLTVRNNIRFGSCEKLYTLNPNNIYDPGAVVTVTSTPYPAPEGGTISVDITCDDPCREITDVIVGGISMGPLTTYTFTNVPGAGNEIVPLMHVVTGYIQIPITATAHVNGAIEPPGGAGGIVNVDCGSDKEFCFIPALGYVVDYFEVDGIVQPKKSCYTFTNVTDPHTIDVYFKVAPYKIIFTHVGDGEVIPVGREAEIPNGQIGMDDGDTQLFIFVPGECQEIAAVYIDGVLNPGAKLSGSYFFGPVYKSYTLHVVFKPIDKTIFASAGPNGIIEPAGSVPVPCGDDKTFKITANTGYVIDKLFIDGVEEPIADQLPLLYYTFENVTENGHTIYATFKVQILEITVIVNGDCGAVTPPGDAAGIVYVPYNAIQQFFFTPGEGCKLTQVLVDGEPFPNSIPLLTYIFTYVTENHTIEVTFEKITYPVKSSINANGVITPNGTVNVAHGTNQKFTWYTFPGFEVVNVFVDGIDIPPAVAAGEYTFTDVKASHYIDVITAPLVYKISAIAEAGGYITPFGDITVGYGQNQMFTFKAASGYEIDEVLINGVPNMEAAVTGVYAFINVKADQTIKVTFKVARYIVKANATGNGMIEPAGITELTYFDEIIYTITPDNGYQVSHVLVNGNNMGPINTYTFTEVEADGTIEVFFNPMGIDQNDNEVSIYSQSNIVYIVNNALIPLRDVSIMDMYGRLVWQGNVYETHNTISLDVANGIYSVRVATETGFTTTKVSIQR
jgi:hypothetical protein